MGLLDAIKNTLNEMDIFPPSTVLPNSNEVSITGSNITGADGDKFKLKNVGDGRSYNLFSDTNLSFIGTTGENLFRNDNLYDIEKTSLIVTNPNDAEDSNCIEFSVNDDAYLDGQMMKQGEIYMLKDGGAAILQGDSLTVKTAEGYAFTQTAQRPSSDIFLVSDSILEYGIQDLGCININIEAGDEGVRSDGVMPTGLLGQTFDDDKQVYTDASIDMKDFEVDNWGGVLDVICDNLTSEF